MANNKIDISGVWDLHIGTNRDAVMAEASLDESISGWSSLYIKFTSLGAGNYNAAYIHPKLSGRAPPNCPYDAKFNAQIKSSTDNINFGYPVMTMFDYGNFSCASPEILAYQVWAGTLREAGVGANLPRYIQGTIYNNNGNESYFVLVYNSKLSM
ncbi:hypothetical protein [Sphingorhabdus lutea]|uniref:hypothetical protein n=1 Tax=Sphingorhabdus lutea TaxID=1913578 RepID=UPI0012EC7ECC|nr:hypothetical protein [Sphingorhabdus lutea]